MASQCSLPSVMRAAYISEYHQPYALGERPLPSIDDRRILVRVHAAGFCHSDLQALQGQFKTPAPLGLIPSHEVAGTVAKLGPAYDGHLRVGARVGILNFKHACGYCTGCNLRQRTTGELDPRFCDNRETAGFLHDGDSLSFEQAAPLMCAGATVWGSLEKVTAGLGSGEVVAIVGIGGLGHLGLQFAKALGFHTIAVDSRPAGRQLATEMANPNLRPDYVVDSSNIKAATRSILGFTNGVGVAAAVVCTDSIEANRWALQTLRVGGVLGVLGLPANPWQFDAELLVFRELSIKGSYVAGRKATERMIETVGKAGIQSYLTTISFGEIPDIVEMYEEKSFKGRLVVQLHDSH
ncbi:hypothetical protein ACCO45_006280 [Purpureocillium lilacinum]|uniref:Uncharacterized protein n=1 Tax=Purpureocillium lilacinum TaxID=33203 RepID=A0ACC4E0U1_PURLI